MMKNALEMVKEVQDYERKKRLAKTAYEQTLENARNGIITLTFWERHVTLRTFKKELQEECSPMEYNGEYYVHPFLCGMRSGKWDARWINYGAFLLEQLGYINVEIHVGIVREFYLKAKCPKTAAEQILFSGKGS